MNIDQKTRQRLLELVYGLLPEAEAERLHRQIAEDASLARAYAEARDTAGLLADAAKISAPAMALKSPEKTMSTSEKSLSPAVAKGNGPGRRSRARWAGWAVTAVALLVLLLPSAVAFWRHKVAADRLANANVRLMVTGPSTLPRGIAADYAMKTTTIAGVPVPAEVQFSLDAPNGETLLEHKERADADGRLVVTIPADLRVPSGTVLRVVAMHREIEETVETQLDVAPAGYTTHLSLDKPLYRPGETVYYRSLTLSRFALAADRDVPIEFEILDPSGAVVPDSRHEGVLDRGVGNGAFEIPEGLAGGQYTLVARSLADAFPEQRRPFYIRAYRLPRLKKELEFVRDSYGPGDSVEADFLALRGDDTPAADAQLTVIATLDGQEVFRQESTADATGAARVEFTLPEAIERGDGQLAVVVDDGGNRETLAKTIPINLGKVDVAFYPEGGDLVAGLLNRVYFVGRDPLGEPVHLMGVVVDDLGREVARVTTTHEGMGSFTLMPAAEGKYRLKITSPADVSDELPLPAVSVEPKIVLNTGTGVFRAGQALEFNVRAAEADRPLVAAVFCRGVLVGQQPLITQVGENSASGSNSVAVALPDTVGGVLRLTVYDYATSPPRPLAERLVYRRMGQGLTVRAVGTKNAYSPGERVEAALLVTNEHDEPVPAVLGVAVVDDALLNLADDDTASMTTHLLLTSEVENPEDLEEADFYLSADPKAEVALDLLLGTQGWRRFAEKTLDEMKREGTKPDGPLVALAGPSGPPTVFDNLPRIEPGYEESLGQFEAAWGRSLDVLVTLSLLAAVAMFLAVAMMGLMRIVSGIHLWGPAVGVGACCLVVGAMLINPARQGPGSSRAVAFAPFFVEPPKVARAIAADSLFSADVSASQAAMPVDPSVDMPEEKLDEQAQQMGDRDEAQKWGRLQFEKRLEDIDGKKLAWDDDLAIRELAEIRGAGQGMAFDAIMNQEIMRQLQMERQVEFNAEAMNMKDLASFENRIFEDANIGKMGELHEGVIERLESLRFTVREYAHQHVADRPGVRSDFAETVFWHPLLLADADGRATIAFDLSDSTDMFRLRVDAHGAGRIGSGQAEVVSRIPFSLEPKLPLEVSAGDRIDLPLAVVNDTADGLPVTLRLEHGDLVTLDGEAERDRDLAPGERVREYFALDVTGQKGDCELTFRGTAGLLADAVSRPLRVVPPGFPKEQSHGGRLDGEQELLVELPDDWVPGSLEVTVNAFPSMLAELERGLDGILQEPYGCFEQASTANYPNILVMQYMEENRVANPAATRRAKELMEKGYAKLVGYECSKKGYEWFGGDPGHEALTAYGLMEFRDMAGVHDVDGKMLERTAQWLMDRRDGKGGFERNARALDSFGAAPEDITNAYIVWALSESGQKDIEPEVEHVVELASASDDPYLIALAASGAINGDKRDAGERLLAKLAKAQSDDGHLEGANGSITRSGGRSLAVETTALATLAWLKSPEFTGEANRGVEWIVENRQGSGGFGSTQATILALKALVEHSRANRQTLSAGTLVVRRDTVEVGRHAFAAGRQEAITVDGIEAALVPGENRLVLSLDGENNMPYAVDVRYRTRKPESDDQCPLRLSTRLAQSEVKAGETVALSAELRNTSDEGQPMSIAILGLPAGLEARTEQLDELKKAGTIDYYETRAREVICYWRSLAPKKEVTVKLDLVAAVPGRYTGPASCGYLYYTSEQKQWADPLEVEITKD